MKIHQIIPEEPGNKVFLGISVIDQMLFDSLRYAADPDPVRLLFKRIKDYGLHRPGFVLYPLHSFGILGMGFVSFITKGRLSFTDKEAGIAIFPQSNTPMRCSCPPSRPVQRP